tara:strand:+ start:226 stop:537 length:312 start_codon:yes stop_codon:yes gene_type:complete
MDIGKVYFNNEENEEYCRKCNKDTLVEESIQTFKNGVEHLRLSCKICECFIRYKQQPLPEKFTFSFGKHKGKTLEEAPKDYLLWLLEQEWTRDNLKSAIEEII